LWRGCRRWREREEGGRQAAYDLALVLLEQDGRVLELDDARLVLHGPHTCGELQRRHGLLEEARLAIDVGDEQGLAVAAQRVLEQVRQLRLAVGRVTGRARLLLTQRHDNLLEVRERTVDVHGLGLELTRSARLLDALRARQINQVELAPHDLGGRAGVRVSQGLC
jgi:hypothetical protein